MIAGASVEGGTGCNELIIRVSYEAKLGAWVTDVVGCEISMASEVNAWAS